MFILSGILDRINRYKTIAIELTKNIKKPSIKNATNIVTNTNNTISTHRPFLSKFTSIRRLLLLAIIWFNYKIWLTTDLMYQKTGTVDVQWNIYAGAWITSLTIFITFYTTSRTHEIQSQNEKDMVNNFVDANNNGIDDRTEDITEEEDEEEKID